MQCTTPWRRAKALKSPSRCAVNPRSFPERPHGLVEGRRSAFGVAVGRQIDVAPGGGAVLDQAVVPGDVVPGPHPTPRVVPAPARASSSTAPSSASLPGWPPSGGGRRERAPGRSSGDGRAGCGARRSRRRRGRRRSRRRPRRGRTGPGYRGAGRRAGGCRPGPRRPPAPCRSRSRTCRCGRSAGRCRPPRRAGRGRRRRCPRVP